MVLSILFMEDGLIKGDSIDLGDTLRHEVSQSDLTRDIMLLPDRPIAILDYWFEHQAADNLRFRQAVKCQRDGPFGRRQHLVYSLSTEDRSLRGFINGEPLLPDRYSYNGEFD
jgi:hypothetical protein